MLRCRAFGIIQRYTWKPMACNNVRNIPRQATFRKIQEILQLIRERVLSPPTMVARPSNFTRLLEPRVNGVLTRAVPATLSIVRLNYVNVNAPLRPFELA